MPRCARDAAVRLARKNATELVLAAIMALAVSSSTSAAPINAAGRYEVAKTWLNSTYVAKCFPGFVHPVSYGGPIGALKIPDVTIDLPVTPIEGHRLVIDDMFPDYVTVGFFYYARFLSHGILSPQNGFAISYDSEEDIVAFNRTFGQEAGYDGMMRVGGRLVPPFVNRATIGLARTRKKLHIGSPVSAVTAIFGPPSITGNRCGMKSVNYVSAADGTVHEYLFIFRNEKVVALRYGGASD